MWFLVNYHGRTGFIPSYYDNSHYTSANDIPSLYKIPTCSTSGHGISTTAAVTMRGTPHTGDASQGSVPKLVSPTYRCWIRGDSVSGLNVWFLATYSGHTGFIPSYNDNSHYSAGSEIPSKYGIPSCGSTSTTPVSIAKYSSMTPPPPPPPTPPPPSSNPPPTGTYVSVNTHIRYCIDTTRTGCGTKLYPDQASATVATPLVNANQPVTMTCWEDGSTYVGAYSSPRWFWVKSSTGVVGFVHSSYVQRQASVGSCKDNKRIYAAEISVRRYSEATARTKDQTLFGNSEWSPGPKGEWSGDCVKLPYVGWYYATGSQATNLVKGNAIDNYTHYKKLGKVKSGAPPVGAVVFYRVTSLGHEAISIGNGMVVTTRGSDGDGKKNAVRSYTSWGSSVYLGYYLPY